MTGVDWSILPWWRRLEWARQWYASHPAAVPVDGAVGPAVDGVVKRWASILGYVASVLVLLALYSEALFALDIPIHAWSFFMLPAGVVVAVSLVACSWRKFPWGWNAANLAWLVFLVYLWVSSPLSGVASTVISILMAGVAGVTGLFCGKWGSRIAVARSMPGVTVPVTRAAGISSPPEPFEYGIIDDSFTAGLLRSLSGMPGAVVFHGLRGPDGQHPAISHAVLRGDRIVLIKSGYWPPGSYGWSGPGRVSRLHKGFFGERDIRFKDALSYYRSVLPEHVRLYAVLLVHGKGTSVDPERVVRDNITMARPQGGMEFIGSVLEESQGHTERQLVNFLSSQVGSAKR